MAEERFEAMGTWCHVIVHNAPAGTLGALRDTVARLQQLWTRFDEASELSIANHLAGRWVEVSPETLALAQRAVWAWRATHGAFDPFVARRMAEIGYDRDFAELRESGGDGADLPVARGRRHGGRPPVAVDRRRGRLRIAPGWELDSGGIGKGYGADIAATTALEQGASAALVNLGGDLRCVGETPEGGWQVTLDDAWEPGRPSDMWVRLRSGAVATSSPLRRRWVGGDGSRRHHLLDPRTGLPIHEPHAAVSVIARQGWIAEALTKAAFTLGPVRLRAVLRRYRAAAIITASDGTRTQVG